MAGLGRKDFQAGAVLSAADVDGYLMDQTVMKFANTAAAGSAYGTAIAEGMNFYLSDTDEVVFHNGTTFAKQGGTGAAGVNKIINGSFEIWQRGTTGASGSGASYVADRWAYGASGNTGRTVSRQTTGLTGFQYAARVSRDAGQTSTANNFYAQSIESAASIPMAGQNVTVSYYARKGANYSPTNSALDVMVYSGTGTDQNYITVAITGQATVATSSATLTTSWQRFTATGTVSASATQLFVVATNTPTGTAGAADYFEITGVQLEVGSAATPFSRAGGTLQGELAACQRYYYRTTVGSANAVIGSPISTASTTATVCCVRLPVTMRINPISYEYSNIYISDGVTAFTSLSSVTSGANMDNGLLNISVASGLTQYRPYHIQTLTSAGYIGFTAEL